MEEKMNIREKAIKNMTAAFKLWEEEYRANPERFMSDAAQKAKTPGDLAEVRALYFADLLDKLNVEPV